MKKLLLMLFVCCLMLLAQPASAQNFTYNANFVYARADVGAKIPANTAISQWALSWSPQGTLTSCSIQIDTSSDGITWTTGGLVGSTPCTTSSTLRIKGLPALTGPYYLRINVTVLGPTNANNGLNVSLQGWSGAF
jgi:hypothetical protein